jgi:hypothetical protein
MPTFREDPAGYMRDYRARKRAEREAEREAPPGRVIPRPAIPMGRPLTAQERREDAELDAIEGRGGTAEWTGDRWREVTPAPRPSPPARRPKLPAARPKLPAAKPGAHFPSPPAASTPLLAVMQPTARTSPPATRPRPPASPRSSVVVCGGRPGTGRPVPGYDPTFAPHEPSAVRWQLHVATMLSARAAKIAAQERRADEAKQRIKATEARATEIAQGFLGTLQLLLNARLTAR